MILVAAAATALLGLIIVIRWPSDSVYVLGVLLGVDLLFHGAGWVTFGMGLRARRDARARILVFQERSMTKWVYSFGAEAEGRGAMKNLLGGKGANLAEMAILGLPVPPGFTITTEVCTYFYANGKTYPADLAAQVDEALAERRPADRRKLRRRRQPAAGLGPLRRARLDAGHDGHRAQPRPQRRDRSQTLAKTSGDAALRLRQLSPLHPDVFERRARASITTFRGNPRGAQGPQGPHARHRP